MKTKTPHATALALAQRIERGLAPHCDRIEIVGSLRRLKPMVGDIELLVIPKMDDVPNGFFETKKVRCKGWMDFFGKWKPLSGKPLDAKYLKCYYQPMNIQVDIFITNAQSWGLQKWLRTGSPQYNQTVLMDFKRRGVKMDKAELYQYNWAAKAYVYVPTPTEVSFYEAIGIEWIPPQHRTEHYRINEDFK